MIAVVDPQPYAVSSPNGVHNQLFARSDESTEFADDLETAIDSIADDLAQLWQ